MWSSAKKMLSKATGGGGKSALKYKLEIQVVQADGLPSTVKNVRVVMSRSAKVATTKTANARGGERIITIYRGTSSRIFKSQLLHGA